MITVGLTGGIGSGKSTAADIFRELGVPIIDADVIAHDIVNPGQPTLNSIFQQFDKNLKLDDGSLNRDALREYVFSDPEKRQQLEAIMHPAIIQKMKEEQATLAAPYCIMVIPLLLENNLQDLVTRILVIDCSIEKQQERVLTRPGIDEKQLANIFKAQVSRKDRLSAADDILHNDDDIASLHQQIRSLNANYLQLANCS
ncbi:MAG: dephospho-CoA kinase [Gammaproteobacteria bacterium]|nr:dephospho-CoA kinase [Gammaproteobacteria bacterium]